jgi:hypothetical protein
MAERGERNMIEAPQYAAAAQGAARRRSWPGEEFASGAVTGRESGVEMKGVNGDLLDL